MPQRHARRRHHGHAAGRAANRTAAASHTVDEMLGACRFSATSAAPAANGGDGVSARRRSLLWPSASSAGTCRSPFSPRSGSPPASCISTTRPLRRAMVPLFAPAAHAGRLLHRHRPGLGRDDAARQADFRPRRGLLTIVIRTLGGYPDGVAFAILLMNLCVPLIDIHPAARFWRSAAKARNRRHDSRSFRLPSKNALRTSTILFVFALVGTAMLAFTYDRTEPTIDASASRPKSCALLSQVLPHGCTTTTCSASQQSLPPDDRWARDGPHALWLRAPRTARSAARCSKPSRPTATAATLPC